MGPAGPRTGRGAGLFILGGNQYFVACYDTFIGNYSRGAGIETGGEKRAGPGPPCFDSPALPLIRQASRDTCPDLLWPSAISLPRLAFGHFPIPSVSLRSTSPYPFCPFGTFPDPLCLATLDISLPLLSLRDISLSPLSRYARHLPLIRGAGPQGKAWREMVEKP